MADTSILTYDTAKRTHFTVRAMAQLAADSWLARHPGHTVLLAATSSPRGESVNVVRVYDSQDDFLGYLGEEEPRFDASSIIARCEEDMRAFIRDLVSRDLDHLMRFRDTTVELQREAEDASKAASYLRQTKLIDMIGDFIYGPEKWVAEILKKHTGA